MPDDSQRKLRICIFNWRDPWNSKAGGAEQVTLEHAKYWVSQGHLVTWVSGENENHPAHERKLGITFYRTGGQNTFFLRASYIYWVTFRGNFDIIIDEIHGIPAFSPVWALRSKKIAFIHEVAGEIWDEMFPFPVNAVGKWIESSVFPRVYVTSQFWVDSSSTKLDLDHLGIKEEQIEVIPCAIQPQPLRKEIKEKSMTCIFLARLVKMKGVESALKVFHYMLLKEPTAQLWIVGTGESTYVEQLKQLTGEMGLSKHVTFYGSVVEEVKYSLLAKAHFLLHTSIKEGFGLTVLEAATQKTPALVFDVPSLRDIVVHRQTGVVAPVGDHQSLAGAAVRTWLDIKSYKSMCELAYTHGQLYKWSAFTHQSLKLLKKLTA